MTAPQTPVGSSGGEPLLPTGHQPPTEQHWALAAAVVTGHSGEAIQVARVARAIAAAEQRGEQWGRDQVRFCSAYCPDCGAHCDTPHRPDCPLAGDPDKE